MFDNVKKFLQKIYILPDDWKNYSDEEIDRFFKRFEKEIEKFPLQPIIQQKQLFQV